MAEAVGSPLWWVDRLFTQLTERQRDIDLYDAYYRGCPPRQPWLAAEAQEEFHRLLHLTKSNYMGLVIDATAERLCIEGFRIGDSLDADKATWRIWQANNLDSDSDQGILEALICGQSYMLIAPNPKDRKTPLIYMEHPSQAIVEYEPGSGRRIRAAGLKVWLDDWTGMKMATLYLPKEIYKFQAEHKTTTAGLKPKWVQRRVKGETWPAKNPLEIVPLVELPNNPRLLTGGVSEIADVIPIQDRISKTLADRLMTQDYGAFPQKWGVGYPLTDADGNPTEKIKVGRDRMIISDAAETKFGQFTASDLAGYLEAKREDVKDIASRTRTPAQYLLGEMNNVNGQTLKAAETGLVAKTRQRQRPIGEGAEEGMRIARKAAGLPPVPDEAMETVWRNPEYRTEGELTDGLVKMATLNVPEEVLWERWGATQVEIGRWKELRAAREQELAERDPYRLIEENRPGPSEDVTGVAA